MKVNLYLGLVKYLQVATTACRNETPCGVKGSEYLAGERLDGVKEVLLVLHIGMLVAAVERVDTRAEIHTPPVITAKPGDYC